MTNVINRRNTTNKKFKDTFENLASTEMTKGRLRKKKRSPDDNQVVEGILKYIIIDKIDLDGWIVEVGNAPDTFSYACYNAQGGMWIPDSTVTNNRYVPKKKTKVEISIDKYTKIYKINRIITDAKIPLASFGNTLYISNDTNTKNNKANAAIQIGQEAISLIADELVIQSGEQEIDLVNSYNQIQDLKTENQALKDRIQNIENQITNNTEEE